MKKNFRLLVIVLLFGTVPYFGSGLNAEPNRRALGKAFSGLTYCFQNIKKVPKTAAGWQALGRHKRQRLLKGTGHVSRYLKPAMQMDPSVQTYTGIWKNGISYKDAFETCKREYYGRLKGYMNAGPKDNSLKDMRFAFQYCQKALKYEGPQKSKDSNNEILKQMAIYTKKKNALVAKDPKLAESTNKIRGMPLTVKEMIRKCDTNYAKVQEYEKPGKIVFATKRINSLEQGGSNFTAGGALYAYVQMRHPWRIFTKDQSFYLYLNVYGPGNDTKPKESISMKYKKTRETHRSRGEEGILLPMILPPHPGTKETQLWEFAMRMSRLPPNEYTVKVSIGDKESLGEFKLDTRDGHLKMSRIAKILYTRMASKYKLPKALAVKPRLNRTFMRIWRKSNLINATAKIRKIVLRSTSWEDKKYNQFTGLMASRSQYMVIALEGKDGFCEFFHGDITEKFIKGNPVGRTPSVIMNTPSRPILCNRIR